jgi:nucleotide-binding universal stress UspA family protein
MAYSGEGALGAPAGRPLGSFRSPGEEEKLAESALRTAVREALGPEEEDVEERTVTGVPGRALVETARSTGAQLVVLAARGEHAARLLGAVSQYVLRNAPCPVLVVPQASKGL